MKKSFIFVYNIADRDIEDHHERAKQDSEELTYLKRMCNKMMAQDNTENNWLLIKVIICNRTMAQRTLKHEKTSNMLMKL